MMKSPVNITRRQFIAAGMAAMLPRTAGADSVSEPDVVVVGAGAAGLAAARTLLEKGRRVVLVEASHRIGGRAHTDTSIFGVPFDLGAHWLHNGRKNPYNKYAKNNGFKVYPVPEIYHLYSADGERVGSKQLKKLWKEHDKLRKAIGRAGKAGKDVAASAVTGKINKRWSNTARLMLGAWTMGKDFDDFSTLDWWNSDGGADYFCKSGFGTLVAHYGRGIEVSLNNAVSRIDWSGKRVLVESSKGMLKPRAVIVTVSTGVLASDQIKFFPELPAAKRESFDAIPMGAYDHIALLFSKDVFGIGSDGYFFSEIGDDGKGFGTLTNSAGSGLAYCDVGGSWGRELHRASEADKIDYALQHLKSLLGNDVTQSFVKGAATAWGLNPLTLGSFASARPGAYKMRAVLRRSVGDRIFFAGEACHPSMWATVGGAHLSGVSAARSVSKLLT